MYIYLHTREAIANFLVFPLSCSVFSKPYAKGIQM